MHIPLPKHLSGSTAFGIAENETIAQYEIGTMRNFVYLVLDWRSRTAAWVDPQRDLRAPLKDLERFGFKLTEILLTHSHHDHVAGVPELSKLHPEVPIRLHSDDHFRIPGELRRTTRIEALEDGQVLSLGSLRIRTLHTPGHSAGECCFLVEGVRPYLLTGDTLFIRDCGNTSSPTGDNSQMFASLQKIRGLSPETVILPGHHYQPECASVLERELLESAPFQCKSVEELAALP
jgi:glyoxylase-like metal-dependent hydrolase (beta-lactamase superfamily II)